MTDFARMQIWDDADATSTNPICLDDILEDDILDGGLVERQEKKKRSGDKKKRRRRRKKLSEEDSSVADSMLSELLSEEDEAEKKATVDEKVTSKMPLIDNSKSGKQRRRERIEQLKAQKTVPTKNQVQPMRSSLYPSSDEETNDDLSKNPFSDKNETAISDDDASKNPFSDRNETAIADDDLSKNPFSDNNLSARNRRSSSSSNPFEDDSMRDRAASTDSDESSAILPPPKSTYYAEQAQTTKSTNPFADEDFGSVVSGEQIETVLEDLEEDDSEEDIIESSKRLLRCVDQRIQYQQQNDEVHSLKSEIKGLKRQAEAMAEQLRRAVETKCDLVLAQNEMERRHEQEQIAKDGELRNLRIYIQDILEQQAKSELNFMNEIASLATTLENSKKKHADQLEAKESRIFQLETKVESMKIASVRGTSPQPYHTRFTNESVKSLFVFPSYE